MAKATKNTIPPAPVEPDFTVTLELTKAEAKLLRDVLYVTGGEPTTTRRRYASAVLSALEGVVGVRTKPRVSDLHSENRSLYFCQPEEL